MEKLILALILAIIPALNFIFKYYFSKKNGTLKLFKNHPCTYFFDWLFVPFNFILGYIQKVSLEFIIIFLVISIFSFVFLMFFWMRAHKKEGREVYMFDISSGKIKAGGIIEFFFFIFQAVLILIFIFFTIASYLVYINILILVIFLLLALYSSKKIHGKIKWFDIILVIFGFIGLALKTGFLFR